MILDFQWKILKKIFLPFLVYHNRIAIIVILKNYSKKYLKNNFLVKKRNYKVISYNLRRKFKNFKFNEKKKLKN